MITQPELNFNQIPTQAPFNAKRLTGQNARLLEWLQGGNTFHCMMPIRKTLRIGYTNSRIADIIKAGYTVYKRRIKVKDAYGNDVWVKEYSLKEF